MDSGKKRWWIRVHLVTHIARLKDQLLAADYRIDSVNKRLGVIGQEALRRNSTIPVHDLLADDRDPQADLIRLFITGRSIPLARLSEIIDVDIALANGLVRVEGDKAVHRLDIRPYGFDYRCGGDIHSWEGWIVADAVPGLDGMVTPMRPDYVLGASPASTTLAQMTTTKPVASALDLGTGCGIQSLHLSTHADKITATDLNPRALEMARLTAELNGLTVDTRVGSLYEPVATQRFDLITTNPPYVMSPPSEDGQRLVYREANFQADGLVRSVVTGCADHLNEGGICHVLANWAITDEPWEERLSAWSPPGCDMWIIERERLDIYSYIEMWLTDAGLAGSLQWERRYREWIDYFKALSITGVGMGWITIVRTLSDDPQIRIESWPHEVAQPISDELISFPRRERVARLSHEQICDLSLKIRHDVVYETMGEPGSTDPNFLVMRQHEGMKRAMQVSTEMAGILGACDGHMPLGTIIAAVAHLLDIDGDQLRSQVMDEIIRSLREGYFDLDNLDI